MQKLIKTTAIVLSAYLTFAAGCACSGGKTVSQSDSLKTETATGLPKARIYKTNGNYDNNVAISLNSTRTGIVSYPAPTDVSAQSAPLALADGYLLDRRGIGLNTGFINMSYADYSALKTVPSPAELKEMLIPGAMVKILIQLPMTAATALNDTAAVNRLIRAGLPQCDTIIAPLVFKFNL